MIAFASFFLGLVAGAQPVELLVDKGVAAVVLELDGQAVGRISAPPWEALVDLGDPPEPHELVARALDAEGQEVGSARQWINLPRDPAETRILLDGGEDGRGVVARLAWQSVVGSRPLAVGVVFDGAPLEVIDPRRIELPDHDPAQLHFLRAELDFPENVVSVAEITFGGTYRDEVDADLTAVPVLLDGRRGLVPPDLAGRLRANGKTLEVVAVEEGPAEIVAVVAEEARRRLVELSVELRERASRPGLQRSATPSPRHLAPLRAEHVVRFLAPWAETRLQGTRSFQLFPHTREADRETGGFLWLALTAPISRPADSPQRLADAVAVAGMGAADRGHRRVVVLITAPDAHDASLHSAASVSHYLEALRVPLEVWSMGDPGTVDGWGNVQEAAGFATFERRFRELARRLDRQRIVWVRGLYLPSTIELVAPLEGIALAR